MNPINDYLKIDLNPEFINNLADANLSGTSNTIVNYEKKISEFFKSKYAIALSSGSAAVTIALKAVGVKAGDEVLLTPTCPLSTVYPVLDLKAIPVFCDIRANNFSLDLNDAAKLITKKTKAIIDIPMWGYPTSAQELQNFAYSVGIPLIFDLAHSHGTKYKGHHLSEFADISCFSTHYKKLLSTGEGGFILTNNHLYYENGMQYSRFGNLNGITFGLNYKLGALQAALGIARMDLLKDHLKIRKENASYIVNNIKNPSIEELPIVENGTPNYHFLLLKIKGDNKKFIDHLLNNGIPSDIKKYNRQPLYEFPLLRAFKRECKNAATIFKTITTIPVHPGVTHDQLDHIVESINRFNQ